MENPYVELNDEDRMILDSYKIMMEGLAEYLGEGYELILHSLENLDKSVIKIINGHYTGRSEGAPITDLALNMLKKINQSNDMKSYCYFSQSKNGAMLKSTTIPIVSKNDKIIGLLCINLHTEISFLKMVSTFLPTENSFSTQQETFAENVDDLIVSNLDTARTFVMNNPSITSSNRNKEIIAMLYEKGIFNMKDAVIKVADIMGISKNTVYMHIRNLK